MCTEYLRSFIIIFAVMISSTVFAFTPTTTLSLSVSSPNLLLNDNSTPITFVVTVALPAGTTSGGPGGSGTIYIKRDDGATVGSFNYPVHQGQITGLVQQGLLNPPTPVLVLNICGTQKFEAYTWDTEGNLICSAPNGANWTPVNVGWVYYCQNITFSGSNIVPVLTQPATAPYYPTNGGVAKEGQIGAQNFSCMGTATLITGTPTAINGCNVSFPTTVPINNANGLAVGMVGTAAGDPYSYMVTAVDVINNTYVVVNKTPSAADSTVQWTFKTPGYLPGFTYSTENYDYIKPSNPAAPIVSPIIAQCGTTGQFQAIFTGEGNVTVAASPSSMYGGTLTNPVDLQLPSSQPSNSTLQTMSLTNQFDSKVVQK